MNGPCSPSQQGLTRVLAAKFQKAAEKKTSCRKLCMHLGGKSNEEKTDLLIAYLRKMNDDLNIPHSINHYGPKGLPEEKGFVPEEAFLQRVERIVADAILDACTGSNPRQPSQEEMVKLLKCCYYDTEVDF